MTTPQNEATLSLVVIDKSALCQGVSSLRLASQDGSPLPQWSPVAHIDVTLTPRLIRQYSLCGDIADRTSWQVAVLRERESRGCSRYVHETLVPGNAVDVRGPRNHFKLHMTAPN